MITDGVLREGRREGGKEGRSVVGKECGREGWNYQRNVLQAGVARREGREGKGGLILIII